MKTYQEFEKERADARAAYLTEQARINHEWELNCAAESLRLKGEVDNKINEGYAAISEIVSKYGDVLGFLWSYGGHNVFDLLQSELEEKGFINIQEDSKSSTSKKKKMGNRIRTLVYERDSYQCVHCGVRKDLSLDHIHPESKGGATTVENLQTLCRSCNSKKGTSV